MRRHVCFVSSIHPWVNPRLVKEADLLAERGWQVSVVTRSLDAESDAFDTGLLAAKPWTAMRVNLRREDAAGRRAWLAAALQSAFALQAYRATRRLRFAETAYYRGLPAVLDAAERTRADFFVAHTQGALPIAARAARRLGVPYGFDCEDLLADEAADGLRAAAIRRAILDIERAYVPGAAYVSATSRAMADHLARSYGIRPIVIRNVFPAAATRDVTAPSRRGPREFVELVWVSATIGAGRGLDEALAALAKLPAQVRLTLIGRVLPAFAPVLAARVRQLGVESRVAVRPVVPARDLLPALARFDIGLAVDGNTCLNRSLTISNKVFLYLQAGLAIAAFDTPGQREIIEDMPRAGVLCPDRDAEALAARLRHFVEDRAALVAAQAAAWDAGIRRYNWERESAAFLAAVEGVERREPAVVAGVGR